MSDRLLLSNYAANQKSGHMYLLWNKTQYQHFSRHIVDAERKHRVNFNTLNCIQYDKTALRYPTHS